MYDNGRENDHSPDSLNEILNELPRERMPAAHLENRIAGELRTLGLVRSASAPAKKRGLRRVEVAWPAAAAAVMIIFFSGVAVGAAARNETRAAAGSSVAASAGGTPSAVSRGGLLLFTADSARAVKRAVWY